MNGRWGVGMGDHRMVLTSRRLWGCFKASIPSLYLVVWYLVWLHTFQTPCMATPCNPHVPLLLQWAKVHLAPLASSSATDALRAASPPLYVLLDDPHDYHSAHQAAAVGRGPHFSFKPSLASSDPFAMLVALRQSWRGPGSRAHWRPSYLHRPWLIRPRWELAIDAALSNDERSATSIAPSSLPSSSAALVLRTWWALWPSTSTAISPLVLSAATTFFGRCCLGGGVGCDGNGGFGLAHDGNGYGLELEPRPKFVDGGPHAPHANHPYSPMSILS